MAGVRDELGLLFQIVDDILDEDGLVAEHGVDGARRLADELGPSAGATRGDRGRHVSAWTSSFRA